MEESIINITTTPVPAGWSFTISDSNNAKSQTSTSSCINFCVSREEVMSYRGGQNGKVDVQPQFREVIVDGSSDPDNDLCITVKCNEKKLFNIKKPKKWFVCQMHYDYKIDDNGSICLTTASAFVPDGHKNVCYIKNYKHYNLTLLLISPTEE